MVLILKIRLLNPRLGEFYKKKKKIVDYKR